MSTSTWQEMKEKFARELMRRRREAGDPSYRTIARHTEVSSSTVWKVLHGAVSPRWAWVEQILRALEVDDDSIESTWRPRWQEMAEAHAPVNEGTADQTENRVAEPPQAWTECPECAAMVGDLLKHWKWHLDQRQQDAGHSKIRRLTG